MKKFLLVFSIILTNLLNAQQDCNTAIPICSDADITLTPSGTGVVNEGNEGCLNGENNSIWFTFSVATAGTLTFLIDPVLNVDYDWALYGPNHDCNNPSALPVRCSYAGTSSGYLTGLNMTATDLSENAGGDGFVRYLDVLPGQVYFLLVDNFSPTISQFSLEFGGTATLLTPFDHNTAQIYQPYPFLQPGPNGDGEIFLCESPTTFDFNTLTGTIVNGNPDFTVKYYTSATAALDDINAINLPISVSAPSVYHYAISYVDPNSPTSFLNKCREYGTIKFTDVSFELTPATLTACSNYTSGVALYDLTTAVVYNGTQVIDTIQYFPTLTDLQAGTNEITNNHAQAYMSAQGTVYVKYVSEYDCEEFTTITLAFYPPIDVIEATLTECFITSTPLVSEFDLTTANITTTIPNTKKFYPSLQDAISDTNSIANPNVYLSNTTTVYARVISVNGCWNIAKINLVVTPPYYSSVLKDKIICIEGRTTLDAGAGFQAYQWSTGATTQVLPNVSVGEYWVELTTDGCVTRQTVKVFASRTPVITKLDITNNTITVTATGGTLPYQFSLDGTIWQDSNVFTNVPRGQAMIYVKDAYDCNPAVVEVTVPNLLNAITPNDDNVNDYLDYSALGYKKDLVLTVYDRYGTKIHVGDKNRLYQWDGRTGNKKVETGTYWYTITWSDPVTNIPSQYSGWVLVKNRD